MRSPSSFFSAVGALVIATLSFEAQAVEMGLYFGPRAGATVMVGSAGDAVRDEGYFPVFSQVGGQVELRWETGANVHFITDAVVLLGGIEQGIAVPSFTGVMGVRWTNGFEIGFGPNLSYAEQPLAMALTAGKTFEVGESYVPLNLAVVPSAGGARISVLFGFNFMDASTSARLRY